MKDLQQLLPFTTWILVLRLSGSMLLEALQAGVSGLPALEGRFPQVRVCCTAFRNEAPPRHARTPSHNRGCLSWLLVVRPFCGCMCVAGASHHAEQVSGIRFVYTDPVVSEDGVVTTPARVEPDTVFVAGAPLDLERQYLLAVPRFIGRGKDGYDVLGKAEIVQSEEAGFTLNNIALNYFRLIRAWHSVWPGPVPLVAAASPPPA